MDELSGEKYYPDAKLLVWTLFNLSHIDVINECKTSETIYSFLEHHFNLSRQNVKEKIYLDIFLYAIQFGKKHEFSKDKLSAFLSILNAVHEFNKSTAYDNINALLKYFAELMACHSVKRPPFSVEIFKVRDVALVSEYVSKTYLKHYKLYKYAFTCDRTLNLQFNYVDLKMGCIEDMNSYSTIEIKVSDEETNPVVSENETAKKFREYVKQIVNDELKQIKL